MLHLFFIFLDLTQTSDILAVVIGLLMMGLSSICIVACVKDDKELHLVVSIQ